MPTSQKRAADTSPITEVKKAAVHANSAKTEKVAILDAGAQYGKVRPRPLAS